jgi:hypothetical protein
MKIKVIIKSGKSRVLTVNSFDTIKKIADKFENWEYK